MRRIFITFIMIFCVFILASCNTTPEDVEEITEAFCRDNPESELCKGEYIDNLRVLDVDQLFFDIQDDVADQVDVCDKYISISNLELLDDCRQGEFTFFPDGME